MACLVTGGAGFIGSHLLQRLAGEGARGLICLDNFNDAYDPAMKEHNIVEAQRHGEFLVVRGDILDVSFLTSVFRSHRIEKVFHLAALAGVRPSLESPADYVEVDVRGTVNLLQLSQAFDVERFIFASSSSVYGRNEKLPFAEDDQVERQISPYAAAKRCGEIFCATYANLYCLSCASLRLFTVYGPRQRPEMAIGTFVRAALAGQPVSIYGDGSTVRDYTYIDDIVAGICAAARLAVPGHRIYNLGSGRTVSLRQVAETIDQVTGRRVRLEYLPEQAGDVPATWADLTRARGELGYEPRTDLAEGVGKYVEWLRCDRTRG